MTTENVPATVQASFFTDYGLYGAATGVAFQTISPAVQRTYGTGTTTFVASASGGGAAVPGYQYRFLVNGTEVQGWSPVASYVMLADFLGGIHTVRVEATTGVNPVVFAETTYVINYPEATGATVAITPATSATYGTAVTVTATGLPATLPPMRVQVPVRGQHRRRAELEHFGHVPWTWHYGSGTQGDPGECEHAERAHHQPGNGADDVHHHHAAGDGADAEWCPQQLDPDDGR